VTSSLNLVWICVLFVADYIDHLLEQVKPKLPPPKNDERSYVGDPALVYLGYRTTLNKLKERHKKQS
jgi:hypothetical protein